MVRISVYMLILLNSVFYADCESYHIAFLGRTPSISSNIGTIFIHSDISLPNIAISSKEATCSPNVTQLTTNTLQVVVEGPGCSLLIPDGIDIGERGIKIDSDVTDIAVHVEQNDIFAQPAEGYLAIPDQYLGNEYYIMTYCSLGGMCQFAVVGVANNTEVNIVFPPNVTVSNSCEYVPNRPESAPIGPTQRFVIDEFDVIHFESEDDLSGTYIWSDFAVAVIVGSRDVPTSEGNVTHMIEQLSPVNRWGTEFVLVPNYLNVAGDLIKLISKDDNTKVHISGFSPFIIPSKGRAIVKRIDWQVYSHIESSNPILILQMTSVDLYNATNVFTGTPAMLIVPHIEQWLMGTQSYFYCDAIYANRTLVSVVSNTDDTPSVPIIPYPNMYHSSWTEIEGSSYSAQIFEPSTSELMIAGPAHISYGICNGNVALLLRANWSSENQECIPTTATAGDDVDNDCDGEIDEDVCTAADLTTEFTSSQQNVSGEISYKVFTVRGAGDVRMKITTCDVAMVSLRANQSSPVQRMNIQVTPNSVSVEHCTENYCTWKLSENLTVTNCSVPQLYQLRWSVTPMEITHTLISDSDEFIWTSLDTFIEDYDQIYFYTLTGASHFGIGLLEKDCKKVSRVVADTHGSSFHLPVNHNDTDFTVIMSADVSLSRAVTVSLDVENTVGTITISPGYVQTLSKSSITDTEYQKVQLDVKNGEISVYLIRSITSDKSIETGIIPIDVLGPAYHTFRHSDTEQTLTGSFCEVHSVVRTAHTNIGTIPLRTHAEINNNTFEDADISNRIVSDRPLATFCGTFIDTMHQLPPLESLGKQYYIPALNYSLLQAGAELLVIATEDSTVVSVRGDYDQLYTLSLAGHNITRTVQDSQIFNITSTKPVQVHLQVRSISWATVIAIPPIEQYSARHVFPGTFYNFVDIISSSAVNVNGTSVASLVNASGDTTLAHSLIYTRPTFALTAVKYTGITVDIYFIISSDVMFNDINEVCELSDGEPGDGVDNDCDGLIDKEQCSNIIAPGNIDFDIDGSLNEDCAANTSSTPRFPNLLVPLTMVTCIADNNENNVTVLGGVEITGTNTTYNISIQSPTVVTPVTSEPFEDFIVQVPTVQISTTTSDDETTEEPVTCYVDCMCPCGWLSPQQNYTEEEIAASVVEIQKKLEVNKESLSSVTRKKTSATDERTSATAVGMVGLAFMVTTVGTLVFLDVATLFRDISMLGSRLKEVFS